MLWEKNSYFLIYSGSRRSLGRCRLRERSEKEGSGEEGAPGEWGREEAKRLLNEAGRPKCHFVVDQKINEKLPHPKTPKKHRSSLTERPRSHFGSILGFVLAHIQHTFRAKLFDGWFGQKSHRAYTGVGVSRH